MMKELLPLLKDAAAVMCLTSGFFCYHAAKKLVKANQPTLIQCIFSFTYWKPCVCLLRDAASLHFTWDTQQFMDAQ